MSIVVIATVKPLEEHRDGVREALTCLTSAVHTIDEGVERFALLEGDDEFVIIEKWVDRARQTAHAAAQHSLEIHEVLAGKLREDPTALYLHPLPAGDAELGGV